MEKTVDMSPEAVTNRMLALDSLWELSVALRSSRIVEDDNEISALEMPSAEPDESVHDNA